MDLTPSTKSINQLAGWIFELSTMVEHLEAKVEAMDTALRNLCDQ